MSGGESAFEDREHPGCGIAKDADLLAFVKPPRFVGHRNFQRMEAGSNQFPHKLVIEVKAIAGKLKTIETIRAQDLEH